MANRRMFNLCVVDTDKFLDLPISSQALYFHLGMRADDDGFVSSPRKILSFVNCTNDDLKVLISKGFVIPFESGIVVITHWKQHNYIQSDRYRKTIYTEERQQLELVENVYKLSTGSIQDDSELETQDRLSKDIVRDRVSIGKDKERDSVNYQQIANLYNEICISFPRLTKLSDSRKKAIKARFNQGYSLEDFKRLFAMAEESSFLKGKNNRNWSASFDWLIKDSNMAKVLDGNYANRQQEEQEPEEGGRTQYKSYEEFERELLEVLGEEGAVP